MTILVFRLSSLGDVILATAFLENLPEEVRVDWVIAREFEFVLKGHPRIRRLISFDKKSGISGWIRLVLELAQERYDYRVDLHRTLRTHLAFFIFFLRASGKRVSISKERLKNLLLLSFKRGAPRRFLPTPYWRRFARVAQKIAQSNGEPHPPSFLPILEKSDLEEDKILEFYQLEKQKYFCVMPASRWTTKEWGARNFFEVILSLQGRGLLPVILGREKDSSCMELKSLLSEAGLPFKDALNEGDFKKTAVLLKNARFYLGCDTGLSHLAESVECPVMVVFGPTQPELGFGPIRKKSHSVTAKVPCSPCSKDGRICYRVDEPYACMKQIRPESVLKEIDRCGY